MDWDRFYTKCACGFPIGRNTLHGTCWRCRQSGNDKEKDTFPVIAAAVLKELEVGKHARS